MVLLSTPSPDGSRHDFLFNPLPLEVDSTTLNHVLTPPLSDEPDTASMNLIVGGALAPTSQQLPLRRRPTRPNPGFRLPSFQQLGIAAPHPDRFGNVGFVDMPVFNDGVNWPTSRHASTGSAFGDAIDVQRFRSVQISSPTVDPKLGSGVAQTPFRHDVATLTPPAETGEPAWLPIPTAGISSIALESPSTDPGCITPNPFTSAKRPEAAGGLPAERSEKQSATGDQDSWISGTVDVLLSNLPEASLPNNPLRILSHALPSPSPKGHIFPNIIGALLNATPTQPTQWINVFHAIQGRFNLADLPTSPPSTPGPAIGGDDYFTQKVFDSAVPVSDYQEDLSSLPRSPHPVVPPSSVNLSIVERYIPPTSTHEFKHMFEVKGRSLLVDRLVELSPDKGSLVFIYPTKVGAGTFMKDYLSPIADPLLRSIQVVNGLSSDLSRTLGTMTASSHLPDFEQMHRSIQVLCARLTRQDNSASTLNGTSGTYTVIHATRANVQVSREAWSQDWWSKQEKSRIREAMTKFAQEAQKKSSNEHMDRAATPTELVQQLLDGIQKRPYPEGQEPRVGIEVSIFVIQRSH